MNENSFTRLHPAQASIVERYRLTKEGSTKETYHLTLDFGDIDFPFMVGDSVGIFCENDADLVERTLQAMKLTGEEIVISRQIESAMALRTYLAKKASITEFSRKLLSDVRDRQTNREKRAYLDALFEDRDRLKEYVGSRQLWDLLEEHDEVSFTADEYAERLMPNLPRLYSIASSPALSLTKLDLTVAVTAYETHGIPRLGVCTHFLCHLAPMHQQTLSVYLQPSKGFTLPLNQEQDIIMVGPGTGVAPFRGFLQERQKLGASGRNWLFFGERTAAHDFYYEDFFKQCEMRGQLRLDTAFSRDQAEKVYVQNRLLAHASEVFSWLESGAILYVCGDAEKMAKDVDRALQEIVQREGQRDEEAAKAYIKALRLQKRYLKDVY